MNFAKNSGSEQILLAEGYMDVIALHQAGFTNTVAHTGDGVDRGTGKADGEVYKKGCRLL